MLFETNRLAVRPKEAGDAPAMHTVYSDAEVMRYSGGAFTTLERTRTFVAAHVRHQESYGFSMWSLVRRTTGDLVGDVGFLVCDQGVEIGWHLRRASWGRGYATEAARACLAHGFDRLGFSRVLAFVEIPNTASVRVIEKLGMHVVGGGAEGGAAWASYAVTPPSLT